MPRSSSGLTVRIGVALAVAALVVYAVAARRMYYAPSAHARSSVGEKWLTNGFAVAVVWPKHLDLSFVEGVRLALDEVNAAHSPLAGKIRLRVFVEDAPGEVMAERVARYGDVVAVLGHEFSVSSIPASVVYENHGILFFAPKASAPRLTTHGFQYVFRLTPDDALLANVMAQFAQEMGFERVAVIYRRTEGGESASAQFVSKAASLGLEMPFYRSYLTEDDSPAQDYRPLIAELRKESVDAIMLADQLPEAAKVLKDLATMGVRLPVLATDKLDGPQLWEFVGPESNSVYVASAVDPESVTPEYLSFRQRFVEHYKSEPGYGATQGYEAFMLLVNACLLSREADPIIVSTTLRTNSWNGLFGPFSFNEAGDIIGRRVSVKRMQNGTFKTVRSSKEAQD
jgi:branched-chain amino acid transport system substrate-binding protein